MLATFKETIKSLQDLKYGKEIIKKTPKQALWYWSQYLLLLVIIGALMAVAALTYFTPQLGKLASDNLPNLTLTIKNGQLTTDVPQPFVRGDDNFRFIIDTKGRASELDKAQAGVLVLGDKIISKSDGKTQVMSLKDTQNFTTSKAIVVAWVSTHIVNIFVFGLVAIILLAAVVGAFFWVSQVVGLAFWALVLMLGSKLMKKELSFRNSLKLTAYASVPSLIVRALTFFSPGPVLGLLALAVFLFYALSWIKNLDKK